MVSDSQDTLTLEYESTSPIRRTRGPSAVSILARTVIGIWVAVWVLVFVVMLIGVAAAFAFFLFTFEQWFLMLAATLSCFGALAAASWYYGALAYRVVSERFW